MKRVRLPVYATAAEAATIRERARAHGVSVSRYLVLTGTGEPPVPAVAVQAERWWQQRTAKRKAQIHRYLEKLAVPDRPPAELEPLPFDDQPTERGAACTHACPRAGESTTLCCGRSPFALPRTDRMTEDPALVTCSRPHPA